MGKWLVSLLSVQDKMVHRVEHRWTKKEGGVEKERRKCMVND
jgi:hypothetical protein